MKTHLIRFSISLLFLTALGSTSLVAQGVTPYSSPPPIVLEPMPVPTNGSSSPVVLTGQTQQTILVTRPVRLVQSTIPGDVIYRPTRVIGGQQLRTRTQYGLPADYFRSGDGVITKVVNDTWDVIFPKNDNH